MPFFRWLVLGGVHFGPDPDVGGADKHPHYVGRREGVYKNTKLLFYNHSLGFAKSHIWKFRISVSG